MPGDMGPEKSWTHRLLRTEQDPPVETDTRLKMCKPDTEHLSYSWSYLFSSDSVYIFSLVILSWRNVIYISFLYIYLSIHPLSTAYSFSQSPGEAGTNRCNLPMVNSE